MKHVPVLLNETVDALQVKRGGRYVDGTLGRAGHAERILSLGGSVLGIDRDEQAIVDISARMARGELAGLEAKKGRHGKLAEIAREAGWDEVDGIVLDLGVSSPQLDEAARGFSFRADGPLDMRMDRSCGRTAADVVGEYSEEELENVFRAYGEEPRARAIAKAIVRARSRDRIETTLQLAAIVERTVGRFGARHPATRVFQALRMEVNDEIGELERALEGGLGLLKAGGRFAVITFESLTDRIVKRGFRSHEGREVSLREGGSRWEGEAPRVRRVTRRSVRPSAEETASNPRSRSARLRVVERI